MRNEQIYAEITEKIIANLEISGSFKKLWQVPSAVSLNRHYYTGVNRMILNSDGFKSRVYGTFQQIRKNGGQVKKGSKATIVVFTKKLSYKDTKTAESITKFMLRYFHVFNTEQADFDEQGQAYIRSLNQLSEEKFNTELQQAQSIIDNYVAKPDIFFSHNDDRAFYAPMADIIQIPHISYFQNSDEFYKALFHEIAHSSGHPKRLNRFEIVASVFGDNEYSKEELVAELCASYLCAISGIDGNLRNSAAYIRGWASQLRDHLNWILSSASKAEKACDYILGRENSSANSQTLVEANEVIGT